MKIRVMEFIGEVDKVREYLNFEFRIKLKDFTLEQFFKKREKAHKKHLEMKERIRKEISLK